MHGEEASISQPPTHPCPGFCGLMTFTVGAMILDSSAPKAALHRTHTHTQTHMHTHTHTQYFFLVEERDERGGGWKLLNHDPY